MAFVLLFYSANELSKLSHPQNLHNPNFLFPSLTNCLPSLTDVVNNKSAHCSNNFRDNKSKKSSANYLLNETNMDENYDIQCGEVFLHLLHGTLTFHCTLCEGKYQGFSDYSFHVASEHSPFLSVDSIDDDKIGTPEIAIKEEQNDEDDNVNENDGESEEGHFSIDENSFNSFADEFEYESLNPTEVSTEEEMFIDYPEEPEVPKTKKKLNQIEKLKQKSAQKEKIISSFEKKTQNEETTTRSLKREIKKEKTEKGKRGKKGKEWPDLSSGARPVRIRYINKDDERIHSCPECDFTCKLLRNLKGHMRRHVIEKPFPCNQCEKGFYTTTELNVHMRFHTGERPYLCTVCGKKFITNTKLRSHSKIHHSFDETNIKREAVSKGDTSIEIYKSFIDKTRPIQKPMKRLFKK